MRIADADMHVVLNYVGVLARQGYSPTVDEVNAYIEARQRRSTMITPGRFDSNFSAQLGPLIATLRETFGESRSETLVEQMCRLKWVEAEGASVADTAVSITQLGIAALGALDAEDPVNNTTVLQSVIDPDDPFAYARVLALVASEDQLLIVDPYLKLEGLFDLIQTRSVHRILTSDEKQPRQKSESKKVAQFQHALAAANRPVALRTLESSRMHDRYFIPVVGPVSLLTTSLNSIGARIGVVTSLERSTSDSVRAEYERLWADAEIVEPTKKLGTSEVGDAPSGAQ